MFDQADNERSHWKVQVHKEILNDSNSEKPWRQDDILAYLLHKLVSQKIVKVPGIQM